MTSANTPATRCSNVPGVGGSDADCCTVSRRAVSMSWAQYSRSDLPFLFTGMASTITMRSGIM